jgi:outer membrane protein TolC
MVEANIDLSEKYIEMLTETEDLMISMYEVGLQPASEKLRVSVQKNEAELQLLIIKNNYKIAKMNLKQVLGMNLNQPIQISYNALSDFALMDLSNGSEIAATNRNELKLLEKQIQLAELDKKMIQSDYLPQLGLGIQYTGAYVEDFREDIEFNPMVAAQLNIPIFQWGQGRKKKQAAQFKIKQNEMDWSRTSDLINLEVQQTKVRVEEAYEAISIAEKNIVAAEESLEETKSSFEVGMNTTTDLLNAQADWLNAKAQQIQAVAQYRVLETSWKRVTGGLNPDTN